MLGTAPALGAVNPRGPHLVAVEERLIGMPLRTFQQKVKLHGLARPRPPAQDSV
jgi:hypothetical protein